MHCINPFDGVPRSQLESHLLIACGFPPDSFSMIVQISSMLSSVTGTPCSRRILIASRIHCSTLPGGGPLLGGGPEGPKPPPPPPPPPAPSPVEVPRWPP